MIKIETKQVISVQDFDDLVVATFGRPYNFQQQEGCQERQRVAITIPEETDDFENDTVPEEINGDIMGVSFKAWLARDPKEWNGDPRDATHLDLFWERNFYPSIQMVANELHARGLIPAGDFVIDIDW